MVGEDSDLPPASPAAATTLYRFKVALDWNKTTWRRIEMRGDQTLDDLHGAIQRAFDWDNDHLYAFFLSGKAWDQGSEYQSLYGEEGRSAAAYRPEGLPLRPKQKIMYVFDFGDDLRHVVTLEAIVPGGIQAGATYPRITKQQGPNEPQYPALDGEDERVRVGASQDCRLAAKSPSPSPPETRIRSSWYGARASCLLVVSGPSSSAPT